MNALIKSFNYVIKIEIDFSNFSIKMFLNKKQRLGNVKSFMVVAGFSLRK